MTTLPDARQAAHTEAPRCPRCRHRHRADLACWKGSYARGITHQLLSISSTCWICRGLASTADHLTPRAHGGGDELENLRPACLRCNSARGTSANPFEAEAPTPPAGVALSPRWRATPDER